MSELLKLDGCGKQTAEKLADAGISTFMALAVSNPKEIATVSGMSETTARKLIKAAREELKLGFTVAKEYAKVRDKVTKISTGCKAFDDMLDGGFESGCISEVYGRFGSGKTQLSHLIVIRALKESPTNKAIFIDTENTFRPDRIKDFAEANELDPEDAMSRIMVARAFNSEHQILLLEEAERELQRDNTYRVIVIDSLTSHFRSEYIGRGTLAGRQQLLNKHMHHLLKIADLYNLVAIVTNQIQSDPGQMFGNPEKPIGGNIVGHNSTFRIYMRPAKAGSMYAIVDDSPNLPKNECNFYIKKEGFVDL